MKTKPPTPTKPPRLHKKQVERIVFALTLRVAEVPASMPDALATTADKLWQKCRGNFPRRGPEMGAQLDLCGGKDALVEFWTRQISASDVVASWAWAAWERYTALLTGSPADVSIDSPTGLPADVSSNSPTDAPAEAVPGAAASAAVTPSLIQQAKSLAGAVAHEAKAVLARVPPVDRPAYLARLAQCETCPHFASKPRRCRRCGCFVDAKILLRSASCPDTQPRWVSVDAAAATPKTSRKTPPRKAPKKAP